MSLSRRDEFAKAALTGMLANVWWSEPRNKKDTAQLAVEWADALITELDRTAPKCEHKNFGGTHCIDCGERLP